MNIKQIGLALLFLDFAALTAFAAFSEPMDAIVQAVSANWWSVQVVADLLIAWGFGAAFVWRDAKDRGIRPLPWVLAIPLTGSLALLAYGVRRSFVRRDPVALRAIAQGT